MAHGETPVWFWGGGGMGSEAEMEEAVRPENWKEKCGGLESRDQSDLINLLKGD